jgi:hypothetical protein
MPKKSKKFTTKDKYTIVIGGGNILEVAGASNGMDRVQGRLWEC